MLKKAILLLACIAYLGAAAYNISTYTYKTVGDLKIELDVYTPPTPAPASGYPIFFAIHGGGDFQGSKQTAFTAQELAEVIARGWAIVSIDYRMLPGVVLADIVEDIKDSYQWIQNELPKLLKVDLNHLTVFGQSAGGGLAVMSAYLLTPRPQAVIAFYSFCTNWTDPYSYKPGTPVDLVIVAAANKLAVPVVTEYFVTNSSDPKNALWGAALVSGKMGWLMTTHDPNFPPEQIMAKLREFSATENADKDFPPTYMAHGLDDRTVPYSQSVQLANVLKENNVPYVLDLVPGADHNFDRNATRWQEHVLPAFDFAQKYMQSETMKTTTIKFLEK